jgi:hypothetical protein
VAAGTGKQLAGVFEGGQKAATLFGEVVEQSMTKTNLEFAKMDGLSKIAVLTRTALEGMTAQMLMAADGNAELAASFTTINDALSTGNIDESFKELSDLFANADFIQQLRRTESTDKFALELRRLITGPGVEKALKKGFKEIDYRTYILQGLKKIETQKLDLDFAIDIGKEPEISTLAKQITTAVNSGMANLESAEEGVIGWTDAIDRNNKQLKIAISLLKEYEGLDLKDKFKKNQELFPDSKATMEEFEDALRQADASILGLKLQTEANAWQAVIEERIRGIDTGPLGRRFKAIADDLGKDLKDATATFLTTGDATTFADALRDAIKKRVVDDSALQLSTSLMANLSPQIEDLRKQMLSAFNVGTDLSGFEKFPETIQSMFEAHPLGKLLGIKPAAQDFVKELRESISDASISLEVLLSRGDLDSVTSSFAERMRSIVSTSFTETPQGIQNAADRFKALLNEATTAGADSAVVRLIEAQIKSLLEAKDAFTDQPDSGLGKIIEASQTLKPVMDKGFEVGNLFIKGATMLGEAFSKMGNAAMSAVSPDATGDRTIQVNIGPQTANVAVDISGSGNDLDEADVASIVDQTRETLMEFVEEQLREVREQLDERRDR